MPRYDVFLSHAGADKPAVERLAEKLRDAGIEPFLDRWHLIPGKHWIPGLDEALAQSGTLAVLIGPKSGGGAWRTREVEAALVREARDESFGVIPVLLPGGDLSVVEDVSRFLELFTWVDFRNGLDDEDAFRRLISGIQGKPPGPGSGGGENLSLPYRCMAPAREPFVQRSEYTKVRDALLIGEPGRGTTVGITTAIHGAGGFGKTALATELCYDPQIRERYPDGILWTTLGEEIDAAGRLSRVRDLIRWWTEEDPPAFETVSAASAHLRQESEGKRVLLVVDDVWRPEDVTPFQGLDAKAALLVTTRDSRTLPGGSVPVHVDAMEIPEAVRLLGTGLPNGMCVDLQALAKRLGEWPLLLKIVNRQLGEMIQNDGLSLERALQEVEEALDAEGLTAFDREDFESRHQAVARTVGASLQRLSGDEVGRFEQLAIFPEDKDIPVRVLEKLWGLDSYPAKKLCGRLHDLSLLARFDRAAATIRLHDIIRAYLLKKGESHLVVWNRRFLDAYRPASSRWSELPRGESYLWGHLFHHLVGAGESDVCRDLLLDFRYLKSKLGATDVNALLADYSVFAEQDGELRLVRDSLRLSAHVLSRRPTQLREQLSGRLLDREEKGIRGLLQESSDTPWLRPRRPCLARPGGALIRTIDHPGGVSALAVLPDGRVISGSRQGTLRVWDVESAQTLQTFDGHSNRVHGVAMLDSRRVVSGSNDGTLRVWDLERGRTLQTLDWPTAAVAVLDSRRVVTGHYMTLQVLDLESAQPIQTLSDRTLQEWDWESAQISQLLIWYRRQISSVAVSSSGWVVSGSEDGTLRVWDAEGGQPLQTLEGHSDRVTAVAVLDSRRVVSGSEDGTLRVWGAESGQTLQTLEGHSDGVTAVAVLDSGWVVSGSEDGTLRVWDAESGQTHQTLEEHSDGVTAVAVLDSSRVVAVSEDGTLRVWDVESGQPLQALEGCSGGGTAVAVLDSHRVISGSSDGTLRVRDVESGQTLQTFEGYSGRITAVAVLDSRRVVSGSSDGILRVWDVESGQTLQTFGVHYGGISAMAVSDSGWVVSGSSHGTLQVWDVESGQTFQTFEWHSDRVRAVAVLDSRRVVSVSDDRTLRVWDVARGQSLQTVKGHADWVGAVVVLDSCRMVSGSYDRTLRVWVVERGEVECLFTLDAPVTALAVIPDRRIIVAGDGSGRVHFFDFVEP